MLGFLLASLFLLCLISQGLVVIILNYKLTGRIPIVPTLLTVIPLSLLILVGIQAPFSVTFN
jgi:hypothetical protein